jgi:cytochrome c oxidase assembly protein subunit 15
MSPSTESATARSPAVHRPALAWFATVGGAWVFVLVLLGAFTTSIGAGMVFKGWPLSDGSLNPTGWLSDLNKFAEHSHRLSAALMSIITLALAAWVWRVEERAWLRKLAVFAAALVLVQAVVGGLRVLLEPRQVEMISTSVGRLFAMLHACLAQIYVCTLLAVALSLSRSWLDNQNKSIGPGVRRLGVACCALLLVQLAVAAVMRHSFAWHTILTFPAATPQGDVFPPAWSFPVVIQFTHTRVLAGLLALALPALAVAVWRDPAAGRGMRFSAGLLVALVTAQITLGAFAIWQLRPPGLTTAHVVVGACTLATAFGLTWWAHHAEIEKLSVLAAPERSAGGPAACVQPTAT